MTLILLPSTQLPIREGRVYSRPVPNEWRQQLSDAYPYNGLGFPWLVWEPGYDWTLEGNTYDEVVERFMLYQCVPIETLDPFDKTTGEYNLGILKELKGPPPESLRQVTRMSNGQTRIIPGTSITQRTWEVFQETNAYGLPIWCVQGTKGGVPLAYPPIYKAVAKQAGLPVNPPMPGTQPYADFDGRTLHALSQYEGIKARAWDVRKRKRKMGYLNRVAGQAVLDAVRKWLEDRSEEWAASGLRDDVDVPVVDTQWDRKLDELARADDDRREREPV